jgi:hypothetical protein
MAALAQYAEERTPPDERLLRYQNGRRITDRRQGGETGTVR